MITRYTQTIYSILLLTALAFGACSSPATRSPSSGDEKGAETNEAGGAGDATNSVAEVIDADSKLPAKGTSPFEDCFTIQDGVITAFNGDQDTCFQKDLVIPFELKGQEITEIGEGVFDARNSTKKLTSLSLPHSLRMIGKDAFHGNALTELIIPKNVATIGSGAFAHNEFAEITIPATVGTIKPGAFSNNPLMRITIYPHQSFEFAEDSFPDKFNDAFSKSEKQAATWIKGADNTWMLDARLFSYRCYTVQDGIITSFERGCLSKVIGTRVIKEPFEVRILKEFREVLVIQNPIDQQIITGIADKIFSSSAEDTKINNDIKLTRLTLPETLKTIGNRAFRNNELTSLIIPDAVEMIGSEAFRYNKLTSLVIPSAIESIGNQAFADNPLIHITIDPHENLSFKNDSFPNSFKEAFDKNKAAGTWTWTAGKWVHHKQTSSDCFTVQAGVITVFDRNNCFDEDLAIPRIVKGQTIIEIGRGAFNSSGQSKKFTRVSLPNTIQKIGAYAFFSNKIEHILIPSTVQKIGAHAFSINRLTGIILGKSVETINASAFANNPLKSITIDPHQGLTFKESSFPNGTSLKNGFDGQNPKQTGTWIYVASPRTWRLISDNCFTVKNETITAFDHNQDNCFYEDFIIPGSIAGQVITRIGKRAFQSKGFAHITLPDTVQKIDIDAFANNQLKELSLGNSVTTIGVSAFSNNQLEKVSLGNAVETIDNTAFAHNQLEELSLGKNVKRIGNNAFAHNQLEELSLGNSVKRIGNNAFANNPLKRITIDPHQDLIFKESSFPNGASLENGFDGQNPKQTGVWTLNGSTWGFTAAP